MSKKD
ncbi:hypothetical protein RTBOTA2_002313 [Rhodotorula toruloides]